MVKTIAKRNGAGLRSTSAELVVAAASFDVVALKYGCVALPMFQLKPSSQSLSALPRGVGSNVKIVALQDGAWKVLPTKG